MAAQQQQQQQQGLMVNNTLDHNSERSLFIPLSGSRQLTWYICGPTVYDSSHLGHARNYLSFDILRRILEDYFNYDVFSVMNITDIDDKIIDRARKRHLFSRYVNRNQTITETLFNEIKSAIELGEKKAGEKVQAVKDELAEIDPLKKAYGQKEKEVELFSGRLTKMSQQQNSALETLKSEIGTPLTKGRLDVFEDWLSLWLDQQEGHLIEDKAVFRAHSSEFEKEFLDDMKALNVRPPHVMARVSEYVPEIIEYIQQIIKNGFAYEVNGSVYFDTVAFQKKHRYAQLEPSSVGNAFLVAEGEGSQANKFAGEKKQPSDFALWKNSRPGEPKWDSPWGFGRPGWHIECSAMASALIGPSIDFHCGGSDLKFPHHDNEIAQAEAYYQQDGWVKNWLHSGHLHIDGLKMSKSLKNFITIREALKTFTARQLRIMFLLQSWDKVMNYSAEAKKAVLTKEGKINNFFLTLNSYFRQTNDDGEEKWRESEKKLHGAYLKGTKVVDETLKDNFNTAGAFEAVLDVITETNKYLAETEKPRHPLLKVVGSWVTKILNVFGLNEDSFGFKQSSTETDGESKLNKEELLGPYIDAFAKFRSDLRASLKDKKPHTELLELSDQLRDDILPDLGIRFEDESKTQQLWKFQDPEELKNEIKQRKELAKQKKLKSIHNKKQQVEKDLTKWKGVSDKGLIDYRTETDKYASWDNEGLPLTLVDGTNLSKSQLKKLKSERDNQKKAFDELTKKMTENPNFLNDLVTQLESLTKELSSLN